MRDARQFDSDRSYLLGSAAAIIARVAEDRATLAVIEQFARQWLDEYATLNAGRPLARKIGK